MFEQLPASRRFMLHITIFIVLLISVFLFFSTGFKFINSKKYTIYFNGSVSGLKIGSSVQYCGVPVGSVESINVELPQAKRVKVIIEINKDIPLYKSSIAKLGMQGLTGYSIVELRNESSVRSELLNGYLPTITSEVSVMERLSSSLPELINKTQIVMNSISDLIQKNRGSFAKIMNRTSKAIKKFDIAMEALQKGAVDISKLLKTSNEEILPVMVSTFKDLNEILGKSKPKLIKLADEGIPHLTELLENLNEGSKMFKDLLRAIPNGSFGKFLGDIDEN